MRCKLTCRTCWNGGTKMLQTLKWDLKSNLNTGQFHAQFMHVGWQLLTSSLSLLYLSLVFSERKLSFHLTLEKLHQCQRILIFRRDATTAAHRTTKTIAFAMPAPHASVWVVFRSVGEPWSALTPIRLLREPAPNFHNKDDKSSSRLHADELQAPSFLDPPGCQKGHPIHLGGSSPWSAVTMQCAHQSGVDCQLPAAEQWQSPPPACGHRLHWHPEHPNLGLRAAAPAKGSCWRNKRTRNKWEGMVVSLQIGVVPFRDRLVLCWTWLLWPAASPSLAHGLLVLSWRGGLTCNGLPRRWFKPCNCQLMLCLQHCREITSVSSPSHGNLRRLIGHCLWASTARWLNMCTGLVHKNPCENHGTNLSYERHRTHVRERILPGLGLDETEALRQHPPRETLPFVMFRIKRRHVKLWMCTFWSATWAETITHGNESVTLNCVHGVSSSQMNYELSKRRKIAWTKWKCVSWFQHKRKTFFLFSNQLFLLHWSHLVQTPVSQMCPTFVSLWDLLYSKWNADCLSNSSSWMTLVPLLLAWAFSISQNVFRRFLQHSSKIVLVFSALDHSPHPRMIWIPTTIPILLRRLQMMSCCGIAPL